MCFVIWKNIIDDYLTDLFDHWWRGVSVTQKNKILKTKRLIPEIIKYVQENQLEQNNACLHSEKCFCRHYNVNGLLTDVLTEIVTREDEVAVLGGRDKRRKSLPIVT